MSTKLTLRFEREQYQKLVWILPNVSNVNEVNKQFQEEIIGKHSFSRKNLWNIRFSYLFFIILHPRK